MNNFSYITLVGWETRNWRHHEKALVWCKDYGLKRVTKHTFIGELYARERGELRAKFKGLFASKTERFFFVAMCKSCFTESMAGIPLKEKISRVSSFELVQLPENA